MSKVVDFPHKEQINEQASLWIARLDRGLSKTEERELIHWIRRDEMHRQVFLDMAELWDKMDCLARLAVLFDTPMQPRPRATQPAYWAVAASLVLVAAALLWGLMGSSDAGSRQLMAGVYETAVGEHSTVNLPDGSQLALNTNSRLEVKYSNDHRLFLLARGEVNIEVAHDDNRPLSVIAGNKIVQAVGTAFNVKIFNEREIELIVTKGKVRVAKRVPQPQPLLEQEAKRLPASAMSVSKGEKVVLGSTQETIAKVEEVDILAHLSWRQGNIIFRGETLEQALAEISRYTSVEFVLDESIKQERIAGLFKAGDVSGLLATLAQNFNINSEHLGDNKVLLHARE